MRTRKFIKVGKHNFYQLQQTVGHSFHESVTSFDDYNTERTSLNSQKCCPRKLKEKAINQAGKAFYVDVTAKDFAWLFRAE